MYFLRVITPVFIGTGEAFTPMECYYDNNTVRFFNIDEIVKYINKDNHDAIGSLIASIDNSSSTKCSEVYENLNGLIKNKIVRREILDTENRKYVCNLRDFQEYNKDVLKNMYNMEGAYIPGTTIKGFIRTAIFYNYIKNLSLNELKELFKGNKKIEALILGKNDRIANDPFRFLIVRDVNYVKYNARILSEEIISLNSEEGMSNVQYVQAADGGSETEEFEILVDYGMIKNAVNGNIRKRDGVISFNKKLAFYLDNKKITECIYNYTNDLIDEDIKYFNIKGPGFVSRLKEIKNMNDVREPIMKLGKDTGYLSHTIGLAIRKKYPEFYDKIFFEYLLPDILYPKELMRILNNSYDEYEILNTEASKLYGDLSQKLSKLQFVLKNKRIFPTSRKYFKDDTGSELPGYVKLCETQI